MPLNRFKVHIIALTLLAVASGTTAAQQRTWVYFKDKGYQSREEQSQAFKAEETKLLPRTRARLMKVRQIGELLNERDLPVYFPYLQQIEALTGLKPHAVIRSINAASYALSPDQIERIEGLSFVLSTEPVKSFRSSREVPDRESPPKQNFRTIQDSLLYGNSWVQNALENFPIAHEHGYTGEGVLVGALDAGWNNLDHVCFDSLDIVATWDFVNGDSSVADDPGQMGSGSHGTKTLSCLVAYDPGEMIGTAYDVSVALAKTENTQGELQIEEDNWAAGIEWLDSLGCEIVTSSVSYLEFQPPDTALSYSWEDLDGNTAISTIAADNAVARGVVVLNSDGNNGSSSYPEHKMNVPADGDSVLTLGSVRSDSMRASFSSYGPTYDGRIKPDLVALGQSVRVASTSNDSNYTSSSGSSFSTPITAGACALLLQADPALTPMQVHEFLKASADQAGNPDTLRGWGIYDVWAAIQSVLSPVKEPGRSWQLSDFRLFPPFPNPFNSRVTLAFHLQHSSDVRISIYSTDGRLIFSHSDWYRGGYNTYQADFKSLSSGIYLCRLVTGRAAATTKILHLK
jgi:hypothetical protein